MSQVIDSTIRFLYDCRLCAHFPFPIKKLPVNIYSKWGEHAAAATSASAVSALKVSMRLRMQQCNCIFWKLVNDGENGKRRFREGAELCSLVLVVLCIYI